MNDRKRNGSDGGTLLMPHQENLLREFFNSPGDTPVLLRSDSGLGTEVTAAIVARQVLTENPAARVLVLSHPSMIVQLEECFRDVDAPAAYVDRLRFRELVEEELDPQVWLAGLVSIVSRNLAKAEDVAESLSRTDWDLLIIDDAHTLRGVRGEQVIKGLLRKSKRVLAITMPMAPVPAAIGNAGFREIRWNRDRLRDMEGRAIAPVARPILDELFFALSAEELQFESAIAGICSVLNSKSSQDRWVATLLVQAAMSSSAAAERALHQLLERDMLPAGRNMGDIIDEEDSDFPTDWRGMETTSELGQLAADTLSILDKVNTDSKLKRFISLVDKLRHADLPTRRVCVLTDYIGTLHSLSAALEDVGITALQLHGGMVSDERHLRLLEFASGEGVLVGTRASMMGASLTSIVTNLILFDMPASELQIEQLIFGFDRLGRTEQLRVHVLTSSNTNFSEPVRRLEILRRVVSGVPQENLQGEHE